MNTVHGRVVVRETGAGVPDLIVVVYDLDPHVAPEELLGLLQDGWGVDLWTRIRGDRLGSVLTGPDGRFDLRYQNEAGHGGNCEKRPDLLLMVTTPEGSERESCPHILHASCGIRQNAGLMESYLIEISLERLRKAGLRQVADQDIQADSLLERLARNAARDLRLRDGLRKTARSRFAAGRERRKQLAARFADPARLLSRVPAVVRESDNYVSPGQSVAKNTARVIRRGVERQLHADGQNPPPVRKQGVLALTQEQRAALSDANGNLRANVSMSELAPLLTGMSVTRLPNLPIDILRRDPREFCRDQTAPDLRCLPAAAGDGAAAGDEVEGDDGTAGGGEGPAAGAGLSPNDLPRYLAGLVEPLSAPEAGILLADGGPRVPAEARFGTGRRASVHDVQAQVDQLTLRGGPAEAPAYHDFYQLQIAFEHVWQEAFDEDLLNLMRETYQQVEDLGGDPGTAFADASAAAEALAHAAAEVEEVVLEDAPPEVVQAFDVTPEQWLALPEPHRERLRELGLAYAALYGHTEVPPVVGTLMPEDYERLANAALQQQADRHSRVLTARYRRMGQQIVRYAERRLAGADYADQGFHRLHRLLGDLRKRLHEPYAFTIYAADRQERSVNFAVLVTYRQRWEPLTYQAGDLVRTVTLAPKETRKFSRKVVTRRRRAEKEVTNNLRSRRDETDQTSRAESEIIGRANSKVNFTLSTQGSFNLLLASGKVQTTTDTEDATASEDTKREFREAVLKATEEYKQERTVEVNTETADDTEAEESGEITNPNEELPVTFLFYELQRRFHVSERIHRVRPVILVAQKVPFPHEVDEDFLVAHDWVLRRALLDDSYLPALVYLSTRITGDEYGLQEMRRSVEQQRRLVDELSEEVAAYREMTGQRYAALERSMARHIESIDEEENEGFFWNIGEAFVGDSGESIEAARMREDAAKDAHERAAKEEREARGRLEREVTALTALTETYTKAISEHLNRKTQVERLKAHVKDNILYYMQAIWSHEPPDQRFFRLHNVRVPIFTGQVTCNLSAAGGRAGTLPAWGTTNVQAEARCQVNLPLETAPLSEVADLDNLLGFKGNYMIFPLTRPNCLTDFMMMPYVDTALGLRDPDEFGNWTLDEFIAYVCCLREHLTAGQFAEMRDSLRAQFRRLLSAPRQEVEELVVPTGSLFIEALPGAHPILEDFKLLHRAMDVKRVQGDLRRTELENLRFVARLLSDELEDPEADRRIVIQGGGAEVVVGGDN